MEELNAVFMQVMAGRRPDALALPYNEIGGRKAGNDNEDAEMRAAERASYSRHRAQEIAERKAINASLGGDAPLSNAPRHGVQPLTDVKPTPIFMQGKQINK